VRVYGMDLVLVILSGENTDGEHFSRVLKAGAWESKDYRVANPPLHCATPEHPALRYWGGLLGK
jgi:hypothetical protein